MYGGQKAAPVQDIVLVVGAARWRCEIGSLKNDCLSRLLRDRLLCEPTSSSSVDDPS